MVRLRSAFRRRRGGGLAPLVVAAGLGAGAVVLIAGGDGGGGGAASYGADEPERATTTSCDIKGNISVKNGERIYHLPGQKYYADTEIRTGQGERWFCSEAEARAAGWRRSKV